MSFFRAGVRRTVPVFSFLVIQLLGGYSGTASLAGGSGAEGNEPSRGSESSGVRLRRGLAAYHAAHYAEAVAAWRPLADQPGADGILLYRYAFALREEGGAESDVLRAQKRSRKALEAAVKKGAGPVECYYLAVLLGEKDDEAASALRIDCFKRLEQEAGNSADGDRVYFLGRLVRTEGDYQERAEKLLRKAVDLYRPLPPDGRGFLDDAEDDLGELLLRTNRQEEALAIYDKGLKESPSNGRLLQGRAAVLEDLERFPEAEQDWRTYLGADPSDGEGWTSLGFALWRQDKNQEALKAFQTGEEKGDTSASHDNGTGLALRDLGNLDAAASAFRRALATDPDWAIPHYNLAGVLLDLGDVAGAEGESLSAIRLDPKDWYFYDRLAEIRKKKGNREGALQSYRDAATADASPDRANAAIGNLLIEDGKPAEGLPYLEKALALNPKDGFMKKDLGQALENLERYPEAEAAYRESIVLAPDSAVPHGYLGSLLESTGRKDEALKEYEAAEKLQPDYG
ncbi:MAG: tetratricopeptide repeat protein, partial [Acidobacteria bacterium]|nr:tetratricopeptide repeat protein [Acidobacteriota bacterium]